MVGRLHVPEFLDASSVGIWALRAPQEARLEASKVEASANLLETPHDLGSLGALIIQIPTSIEFETKCCPLVYVECCHPGVCALLSC